MSGDVTRGAVNRIIGNNLLNLSATDNMTASTTGTQASGTLITTTFARFSTVGTAGASATLPLATKGLLIYIYNESAANYIQVFPASGQVIDARATDAAAILLPGASVQFQCGVDGIWQSVFINVPTFAAYNANTSTTNTTLTATNLGGYPYSVLNMTGAMAGNSNAQLPTVSSMFTNIPNLVPLQAWAWRVINSSSTAFTWTVTTNTGWTLAGSMTVAQNTFRDFVLTFTSSSSATLQSVGTGSQS